MAGTSRQHRGEKRRKELARKARQEEKRQRKTEKKTGAPGGGPPIDWEAGEAGTSPASGLDSGQTLANPEDVKPS